MRGKHGDEERRPATHACPKKPSSGPTVNTSASSVTPGPLRARRERPRYGRPAEQRDELAPLHSITSSARRRNDSGIGRLIALAVLRLIASSNFVGSSM